MSNVKEVLSRLAGMARTAKASLSGDPGVLSTLAGEHAELALLMKAVVEEGHDDHDVEALECRRELFHKIRVALLSHSRAEEQQFYATLERFPDTHDRAVHSETEHREIEHLIRRLDHMSEADLHWLPTFTTLQMKVEAHVEEEESILFEEAKLVLDKHELREIDDRYIASRRRYEQLLEGGQEATSGHGHASV